MEEQVLDDITASLFETENDDNDETSSNYTNSSAVTAAEGKTTDPVAENKIILHEEYPENIYDEPHENGFGEDVANNSNESPSAVIREVSFSMSGAIIKKQVFISIVNYHDRINFNSVCRLFCSRFSQFQLRTALTVFQISLNFSFFLMFGAVMLGS